MNSQKGFIQNIVIIVVLLLVVFLSQQPNFNFFGKNIYTQSQTYFIKAEGWVKTNIWPKVGGEVSKAQISATQEITKQKNNFVQTIWENIKNYFAQKFSKTFGTEVK